MLDTRFLGLIAAVLAMMQWSCDDTSTTTVAYNLAPTSPYTVWNTAPNPESVTVDGYNVYITHFGPDLKPTRKDGDGYVAVYDANGTLTDTLVSGLHAPKGSLISNGIYYVADVDYLRGFDLATGEEVFDVSFVGETRLLNGLAATDAGKLYVSATDAGKIWEVDASTSEATIFQDLRAVNGLVTSTDNQTLFAVTYPDQVPQTGRVCAINLATKVVDTLGNYRGLLDGIDVYQDEVVFTDWSPEGADGGKVLATNIQTGETRIIASHTVISGPADFDVLGDGLALIPMLTGARIVVVPLQDTKSEG